MLSFVTFTEKDRENIIPTSEIGNGNSAKFSNDDVAATEINLNDERCFSESFEEVFSIFPSYFFCK